MSGFFRHSEDRVTGPGRSLAAIYSLPGVCGGTGRGPEPKFQTHTEVVRETDIPRLRPATSPPSGSRHERQTRQLPELEEEEEYAEILGPAKDGD